MKSIDTAPKPSAIRTALQRADDYRATRVIYCCKSAAMLPTTVQRASRREHYVVGA
jgi:hypothetical protein